MVFEPFERKVLPEKIKARILSLIREKRLRPGDKLPSEREMADMMQLGRPALREALRALSVMNIIEIRPGNGTYVTSLEPELLVEPLDFVFLLDNSTVLELLDTRKILELGIVALAAQQITDEEIAELEACLAKYIESMEDPETFLQIGLDFHTKLVRATRNPFLIRIMASLNQLSLASRRRIAELFPDVPKQSVEDHQALLAALKARDPERARQAMLQHLDNVEQKLKELISSEQPETPVP